ncbi:hypothetical protein HJC23_008703 [Cyclotella cryptica]|uniref:Uncharacterized protein n=1 Tax=Cyclotella cryptica TaxID=29204 RepID=A0ABD3QID2_9STRA
MFRGEDEGGGASGSFEVLPDCGGEDEGDSEGDSNDYVGNTAVTTVDGVNEDDGNQDGMRNE